LRGDLKAKIEEAANLPLYHPFEVHFVTTEEAEVDLIYREAVNRGIELSVSKLKSE